MAANISVTEVEKRETLSRLMRAYISDDIILSDKDKVLYDRLVAADEVVKDFNYPTTTARAEYLADKFGISMATARRDLQMAAELFNNLEPFDPSTCARVIMHQVDKFLALCQQMGDMRSAAAFMKIKVSVMTDFVLSSTRSDNENTAATGGFAVLCAVNEGDYTAETEALQTAFEIGVQILARMRRDKNEMRIQEFLEMDIDNVPWETIGPVGPDNAFGILFKLKTYHPIDLYFNPEDWNV